jgi:hypothetical protein
MPMKTCPSALERNINSVHSIEIQDKDGMINCKNYFPNITELTLNSSFLNGSKTSLLIWLNNIIPLKQITKLSLDLPCNSSSEMIELLHSIPNIHTFKVNSLTFEITDLISIENSEIFQLLSTTNNIKHVIILSTCGWDVINFFINLCPRLQHLTFDYSKDTFRSLLGFLLSKDNHKTRDLFALTIEDIDDTESCELNTCITAEKVPYVISTKRTLVRGTDVHLWW